MKLSVNYWVAFLFIVLLAKSANADKLESGFERLKVYDYFSAKEYFETSLEKKPAGAAFGLSKIFSVEKNPFFNLDLARKYILVSDSSFRLLSPKEKKYFGELGVTEISINNLSDEICSLEFDRVELADSLEAYEHFLFYFSSCMEKQKVIALRNSAAFRKASKLNSSFAYLDYTKKYSAAAESEKALDLFNQRLFEEQTVLNTIPSFEKFINDYPDSPYKNDAYRMIYKLSIIHGSVNEFVSFARKYPSTEFSSMAWRQVYSLSMKDFSENTFLQFKNNFPDYPFVNEMESDYKIQNFIFLPIIKNNKWGYINEEGQEMIAPQFEEADFFSEGLASVQKDGKYGYINKAGKIVLPFLYDDVEKFKDGFAIVMKDSLYGLINRKGEFVIDPSFEELTDPIENICVAAKGGKSGYLTTAGKSLTGFIFNLAYDFKDGIAIAAVNDKFGTINSLGKFVIEPMYDELLIIGHDRLKASNNGNWGIVNFHGQVIVPFVYDAVGEYGNGLALVAKDGKYGYVNDTGAIKIPLKYLFSDLVLNMGKLDNGYVLLRTKSKQLVADSLGTIINFVGIENYGIPNNEFYPVMKYKKWGFADGNGKMIIQNKFEEVNSFESGYAVVKQKGMYGLIDTTGNFSVLPLYDHITLKDGFVYITKEGKLGMITKNASLILPCAYTSIDVINDQIIRGVNSTRLIYVNRQGRIIYIGNKE